MIPPTTPFLLRRKVPTDGVVVDRYGVIRLAGCDGTLLGDRRSFPLIGQSITMLFAPLLHERDSLNLATCLGDATAQSFALSCKTAEATTRYLSIIGRLLSGRSAVDNLEWLLVIQDVSALQPLFEHGAEPEDDLALLRKKEKRQLDEATASLIETNVALRKEIRDRQDTLERLSISEARFRNLTETTSDFIWEINSDGIYTYASPKSLKLLGMNPNELLGTPFLLLRQEKSGCQFAEATTVGGTASCGFSKIAYSHTRQDGTTVVIESSGEPIFSKRGQCIGYRGIDRDVTERYIYESQLRNAKEIAESASLAKSEFLANMSHELRTPLHAILSFAGYGEKRIESASRDELLRFFSQITVSGQRLLPLINSLLDSAKLESGKMIYDFQHGDLLFEIRSAINELTPLAEKKEISFLFTSDHVKTVACFDKAAIAQVLRNILGNAVKFGDCHSPVSIAFTHQSDHENKQYLETIISNYGPPIPASELQAIFDKFTQSSKTKTEKGGTGLGLSICRQIIESHNGRIWVTHGDSGDVRFHFTLPCSAKPTMGTEIPDGGFAKERGTNSIPGATT